MESYSILISGKVQQVYYRKFVSQALMKMGIQGYVKNLSNDTVLVVARIYDDEYDAALDILHKGSPLSEVTDVSVQILDEDDLLYDGFEIRY